jgi:hypothetical protein
MRIEMMGQGPVPDFSVNDLVVNVEGVEIDCAPRQTDKREIIDIRATGDQVAEGTGDALVASIVIPPIQYEEVPADPADPGGEAGEESVILQQVPLSSDLVLLRLWPRA